MMCLSKIGLCRSILSSTQDGIFDVYCVFLKITLQQFVVKSYYESL